MKEEEWEEKKIEKQFSRSNGIKRHDNVWKINIFFILCGASFNIHSLFFSLLLLATKWRAHSVTSMKRVELLCKFQHFFFCVQLAVASATVLQSSPLLCAQTKKSFLSFFFFLFSFFSFSPFNTSFHLHFYYLI